MTIPPSSLILILGSGSLLPFAAFLAANPDNKGKWKPSNLIGLVLGIVCISIVSYQIFTLSQ